MSGRKIRPTQVGLVAMPADRDESTVTADDLASDPSLCTAWAEIVERAHGACCGSGRMVVGALEVAWNDALNAASYNDLGRLRDALLRARAVALREYHAPPYEDAALAMLPPVAGRRAA